MPLRAGETASGWLPANRHTPACDVDAMPPAKSGCRTVKHTPGGGQVIALAAKHSGVIARVRQAADAKKDIRRIAMGIDKIVGQRQVKLQFGMPGRQFRKPGAICR